MNKSASSKPSLPFWLPVSLALFPLITGLQVLLTTDMHAQVLSRGFDFKPVIMILLIIAALNAGLGRGSRIPKPNRAELAALVILGVVILSALVFTCPEPASSVAALLQKLVFPAAAFATSFLVSYYGWRLGNAFGVAIFATCLLHLPILVWVYFAYVDDPRHNWLSGPVGFWHVRVWAMVIVAGIGAGIGLFAMYRKDGSMRPLAIWIGLTVLWSLLFWSGTRGGVIAVIGAYAMTVFLLPRQSIPTLPAIISSILIGAALSAVPAVPSAAYGAFDAFRATVAATSIDQLSTSRVTMWRDVIDLIRQHPFLGWGYDLYPFLVKGHFEGHVQPHNSILEFLLSFGLVGGTALIFLLFSTWLRGTKLILRTKDPRRIGAFTGLNALLIFSLVDGSLYHADALIYVAIFYGILLSDPATRCQPTKAEV